MLLFAIIQWVAKTVLVVAVITQFGFVLISGEKNERILVFSKELSKFLYEIFVFLTFNSEAKPFPFSPWPESEKSTSLASTSDSDEK